MRPRTTLTAPAPPAIFQLIAGLWSLPEPLARCWWGALYRARWSEAVDWRRKLLLYEKFGEGRTMAETLLDPKVVMHIVALLEQEGRLSHADAGAIAECLLAKIGSDGCWD